MARFLSSPALTRLAARTSPHGRRGAPAEPALPPGEPAAEVRGATVRLGGRAVLDGVDLTLVPGEVLALVGPNGAGKSTLLATLAADTRVSEGAVHLAGRPADAWTARELAVLRAVLPQATTLSFPFTVAEVVRMGRAPWAGTPHEDDDETAVAEAMAVTEIADFAARPFSALSGGERARVALARVLAQRAPVLLLDEPTAALDLRHQELVLRLCRERAAEGEAVGVVLHDLALAAAYVHRIALLDGGRLTAVGPPGTVLDPAVLSRVYRHPVEVVPHPRTGAGLVLPVREAPAGVSENSARDAPAE
ncbi:iron complex transport system ATP-binding protein [Streptomyces sp. Amel2xB2]|uniref:heme ABC transporter ATP-binding protein n=1 Tax=Streptomyces sp. Amel2xB2 TaxID=1305829 RepID=UPI000DBA0A37|nr:heme ABC transporter ATP-binding protein [Streptomyces sp. Amel2xB2]RAJ68812.1 iron complex transport system ATP-binding protein [Streptomyces sp. Amel2xB2]